jgi:hypothetical protein
VVEVWEKWNGGGRRLTKYLEANIEDVLSFSQDKTVCKKPWKPETNKE